jgi:hypothetical protein
VAAARCIEGARRPRPFWPVWAVLAGFSAVSAGVWFTHFTEAQRAHFTDEISPVFGLGRPEPVASSISTSRDGIAVRAQGSTLTLLHPRSAVVSFSGASGVSAQYVDEETGRVTITAVYGQ